MRKILAFAFMFVFLSAATAYADTPKIVSCDLQKVAENSEAFKAAQASAEKNLAPVKKRLEDQKKAIENDIRAAGANPDKAKQDAILKRQEAYMNEATTFLQNVQQSELIIRQEMDAIILEAAKNYAQKNKCALVLDAPAVLFMDPSLKIQDVTGAMTSEVNAVWRSLPKK